MPPARTLPDRVARDLHRQQQVRLDVAACLVEVELGQRRVVGARARHQDVVDLPPQLAEEPVEAVEVRGVERGDAAADLEAGAVKAIGIARGDDHVGSGRSRQPGRLEPDPGASADHDDGLLE